MSRKLSDWGSTPSAAPVPNLSLGDFAPEKTQSRISADGSRWVVTMDCRNFHPEDISIRTIGAAVEVRAKTVQSSENDSNIVREFNRKYHLPEGLDPQLVESTLTYDGMLIISAPLPNARPLQSSASDPEQTIRLRPVIS
ncbi:Oidioi.mRNA.OKI2018_I69.chr2.g4881.t1.cds [Oikopleura dioica]|uniref:Oidioi.mRNA.OKI2018_I69.chr2.g4881.t1.cds n=1 Tax=Oikopleura dioica TaxID=34765 RepID=A0ABN7T2F6_OIKDI|nr:Oidioi.mRNA.OKI2018_I69.chr2.g4881.t1.cds [Oikopleura dioica]